MCQFSPPVWISARGAPAQRPPNPAAEFQCEGRNGAGGRELHPKKRSFVCGFVGIRKSQWPPPKEASNDLWNPSAGPEYQVPGNIRPAIVTLASDLLLGFTKKFRLCDDFLRSIESRPRALSRSFLRSCCTAVPTLIVDPPLKVPCPRRFYYILSLDNS